jgi:hypothetical protein
MKRNIKEKITLTNEERQRCEVWTRVMGYYRPVSQFNLGKKSEHKERLHFKEVPTKNVAEVLQSYA